MLVMSMRSVRWAAPAILLATTLVVIAASPNVSGSAQQADQAAKPRVSDEGIPVTDAETRQVCGSCHAPDDRNRMTRISDRRASPENWELTIRRMMSLNNVQLTPETARRILKYLSDSHGLAPEEARPATFDAERRMIDYTYEADQEVHTLCSTCHSFGRVLNERRTREEWAGLVAMHRYYYPLVDGGSAGFRSNRGGGPGRGRGDAPGERGRGGAESRQPYERAQEHLAGVFPLTTPAWTAWSAAMRTPRLAGRWALAGYEIGKGPLYGEFTITDRQEMPDAFVTDGRFTYTRTGQAVSRRSRGVVYTGFNWRGRSADTPDDPGTWREVAFIERNGQEMSGRWFTGAHDETGIDVTLRRVSTDPVVLGTDISALRAPAAGRRVRIFGANLPASVAPADVVFGQGVRVTRVAEATPTMIAVDVDVDGGARMGPRDLSVAGFTKAAALVVYTQMDGIKVVPRAGMARVGGAAMPARPEQFEARGVSNGPDGKPNTADDLDLGPVDARWMLEEYTATFKDDDLKFVGELSQNGLFTPNVDGPNPQRSGNRNNIGDVWVVATHAPEGAPTAKPLRARSYLLVTVPIYMDWRSKVVGR